MFQHDVTTLVRTSDNVDSDVIVTARCDADVTREHGKAEGSRSCEEGKEWLRHNTAVTYTCVQLAWCLAHDVVRSVVTVA